MFPQYFWRSVDVSFDRASQFYVFNNLSMRKLIYWFRFCILQPENLLLASKNKGAAVKVTYSYHFLV